MDEITKALDALAVALTEHNHLWSPELRSLYESAIDQADGGSDIQAIANELQSLFPVISTMTDGTWCVTLQDQDPEKYFIGPDGDLSILAALKAARMSGPKRIQRIRHIRDWRKPEGVVNITRPGKWGNEYVLRCADKKQDLYYVQNIKTGYVSSAMPKREAAAHAAKMFAECQLPGMDADELRGKDVMCWCRTDWPCHGDPLLKKANEW